MTALKQGFKDRAEKIRLDLVELETSRSQPSTQDPAALTHSEDNEVSEQSSSLLDCAVNDNYTEDVTDSNNLFLPSDEEFDDLNFAVGNTIVKHYLNPRDINLLTKNVDLPKLMEGIQFKATPVALNNHLVFIAVNNSSTKHKGGRKSCGLSPVCRITWTEGSEISKVKVLVGPPIIEGSEVWSCYHHSKASREGVKLQTQVLDYTSEKNSTPDEKENTGTKNKLKKTKGKGKGTKSPKK